MFGILWTIIMDKHQAAEERKKKIRDLEYSLFAGDNTNNVRNFRLIMRSIIKSKNYFLKIPTFSIQNNKILSLFLRRGWSFPTLFFYFCKIKYYLSNFLNIIFSLEKSLTQKCHNIINIFWCDLSHFWPDLPYHVIWLKLNISLPSASLVKILFPLFRELSDYPL